MKTYSALEGFDSADVDSTIIDVSQVIAELPGLHSALWAIFNDCPNRNDTETMEQFLAPEDIRHAFYEASNAYAKALKIALGFERLDKQGILYFYGPYSSSQDG